MNIYKNLMIIGLFLSATQYHAMQLEQEQIDEAAIISALLTTLDNLNKALESSHYLEQAQEAFNSIPTTVISRFSRRVITDSLEKALEQSQNIINLIEEAKKTIEGMVPEESETKSTRDITPLQENEEKELQQYISQFITQNEYRYLFKFIPNFVTFFSELRVFPTKDNLIKIKNFLRDINDTMGLIEHARLTNENAFEYAKNQLSMRIEKNIPEIKNYKEFNDELATLTTALFYLE